MGGLDRSSVLRPHGERGTAVPGAGTFGVALFVTSLGVFFAAALLAYLAVRLRAETWPPGGGPGLPRGLWGSTLLILAAGVAIQWALARIRRGDERGLLRGLLAAGALSLGFLASQALGWVALLRDDVTARSDMFGFTFYLLTGLHAAHIVGGLAALGCVVRRARRGAYSWANFAGVRHCAIYWHFLAGVWLVMFGVLSLSG